MSQSMMLLVGFCCFSSKYVDELQYEKQHPPTPRAKSDHKTIDEMDRQDNLYSLSWSKSFAEFFTKGHPANEKSEGSPQGHQHFNFDLANDKSKGSPRGHKRTRYDFAKITYKILVKEMLDTTPETNLDSRTSIKRSKNLKPLKVSLTRLNAKSFADKLSWYTSSPDQSVKDVWKRTNACAFLLWYGRQETSCKNDIASIWVASLVRAYDKCKIWDNKECEDRLCQIFYLVGVEPSQRNMEELKQEFLEAHFLKPENFLDAFTMLDRQLEFDY